MEDVAVQSSLAIEELQMMVILSLALNVILLFAFAYLIATRGNNDNSVKLQTDIKKLSNDFKRLEGKVNEIKPKPPVNELPPVEVFGGLKAEEPQQEETSETGIDYKVVEKFVEDYNLLAASMSVPKQRQACEKFIKDRNMKMIRYAGLMQFLTATDVEESNYWAWKIPDKKNLYAVVPNPMTPCDKDLYERRGLNTTFESNYKEGSYARYIILMPATFTANESDVWQFQEVGELNLVRK